jgi:chloramphenicol O-acetyltransferase type A
VTRVWEASKDPAAPSFFLTSLYLMLEAANETAAFRQRIRKGGVWEHDTVAVGPTILREDGTFGFARLEFHRPFDAFARSAGPAIAESKARANLAPANEHLDDIVYQSTLPWLRFTAFTNALGGRDSIPRIVFGRCDTEGGTTKMPVAVEVHHALVDGSDVAAFIDRFQTGLQQWREES